MSGKNPPRSSRSLPAPKKEEPKNVFAVEKVLNKRNGRQGQVEFLIKWQGFPESENTWEPRENLQCGKMLEEFEREFAKRERPSRKRRHSPRRSPDYDEPSTSSSANWQSSSTEQWAGKSLRLIIGLTKAPGELHFLCKFSDDSVHLVPSRELNVRFPSQVIRFYESRLAVQENRDTA